MGTQARLIGVALFILLIATDAKAQLVDSSSISWSAAAGYSAFKDELNVGLVYQGATVGGSYAQRYTYESGSLSWQAAADVEYMDSRGMPAIALNLRPWDVGYVWNLVSDDWWLGLGTGFTGTYRFYANPMQQSGSFFWYTHYDLELRIASRFTVADQDFRLALHSAVFTLASRPVAQPDPYYYNWNFVDMVSRAHSNMTLGSLDMAENTRLQIEWFLPGTHRTSLMFESAIGSYSPAPSLNTVSHSLRFTWYQES